MSYKKIIFIKAPSLDPMARQGIKMILYNVERGLNHCINREGFIKKDIKREVATRKWFKLKFKRYDDKFKERLSILEREDLIETVKRIIARLKKHLDAFDEIQEKAEGKMELLESDIRRLEKAKVQDTSRSKKADDLIKEMNKIWRKIEKLSDEVEEEREVSSQLFEDFNRLLSKEKRKH